MNNLNPPSLCLWANFRHRADGVISAPPWCAIPVPDEHVLLREVTCEGRRCSRTSSLGRTAAGSPPGGSWGLWRSGRSLPPAHGDACPCVWSPVVPSPQGAHSVHSVPRSTPRTAPPGCPPSSRQPVRCQQEVRTQIEAIATGPGRSLRKHGPRSGCLNHPPCLHLCCPHRGPTATSLA